MIYIHKNNQQSGPYEEHLILDQLKSGILLPDDMAIRHGESQWQPLRSMFPQAVQVSAPAPAAVPFAAAASTPVAAPGNAGDPAPLYRKTTLQKIFFGLMLLLSIAAFAGMAVYLWSMMGSTGDLESDLGRLAYRQLAQYAAIALFILTALAFFAFLLTFKRKIIRSNGLRIVMRLFFLLLIFIGIIQMGYAAFSYLNYSSPLGSSPIRPGNDGNELLKALDEGEKIVGPIEGPSLHAPIALGLILFGLSGALMTKRGRENTA